MEKNRKGQSTLEYVIIVMILIGVFVAVGRMLQPRVFEAYNSLRSGLVASHE